MISEASSSKKPAKEIKEQRENDTDEYRRCDREVKREIIFFVGDIPWKLSKIERKSVTEEKHNPYYDDHNTHKDKAFPDL